MKDSKERASVDSVPRPMKSGGCDPGDPTLCRRTRSVLRFLRAPAGPATPFRWWPEAVGTRVPRSFGTERQSMPVRHTQPSPSQAEPLGVRQSSPPQQGEPAPQAWPSDPQAGWQRQSAPVQAPPPGPWQESPPQQGEAALQVSPATPHATVGWHTQLPAWSQGRTGFSEIEVQVSPPQQL